MSKELCPVTAVTELILVYLYAYTYLTKNLTSIMMLIITFFLLLYKVVLFVLGKHHSLLLFYTLPDRPVC